MLHVKKWLATQKTHLSTAISEHVRTRHAWGPVMGVSMRGLEVHGRAVASSCSMKAACLRPCWAGVTDPFRRRSRWYSIHRLQGFPKLQPSLQRAARLPCSSATGRSVMSCSGAAWEGAAREWLCRRASSWCKFSVAPGNSGSDLISWHYMIICLVFWIQPWMPPSFAALGDIGALRNTCSHCFCLVSRIDLCEKGCSKLARILSFAILLLRRELNPHYVLFCLLFFSSFIWCFRTGVECLEEISQLMNKRQYLV